MLKASSGIVVLLTAFLIGLFPQDAANPAMMLPFALIAGWLLASGTLSSLSLRDPFTLLLSVLWLVWTIAAIHSPVPFVSEVTWVILGALPVSFLAAKSLPPNEKLLRFAAYGALAIFGALAIWVVADIIFPLHGGKILTRGQGPFDDPNLPGILLAAGLLMASAVPMRTMPRIAVFCLLLVGIMATGSRSAILGLIAGGALLFFLTRPKPDKKHLATLGTMGVVAILATGVWERFASLIDGGKEMVGRLAIWESSLDMLTLSPLFGVGPGVFHLAYPAYRLPGDDSAGWWVHMDSLQWAIESGWIAGLLFYGIFAFAAQRVWLLRKSGRLQPHQAASTGALLCLFVCAHTTYILHIVPFLMLTGICFAVLENPEPKIRSASRRQALFGAAVALTLTVMLWTGVKDGYTLALWNQAMKASHTRDAETFKQNVTACLDQGSADFPDCALLMARALTDSMSPLPEDVLKLLDRADAANPYGAEADYLRARYFAKLHPDDPETVEQHLTSSLSKNPAYWPARRMLLDLLIAQVRYEDALAVLKKGKIYKVPRALVRYYKGLEQELLTELAKPAP